MKVKKQVNNFFHNKSLLFLLCIILPVSSCINVKQGSSKKNESIVDKNKLVNIEELYYPRNIYNLKEINRIDSITSFVADTAIGIEKKYEIIYYLFNRSVGVDSWEVIRFDDMLGSKVSYCHSNKNIQKSAFQVDDLKQFLRDKGIFNAKLSYNVSYIKGYRKYLVFKENDKIIFCDILITSSPDDNFENTSFINTYLKTVDESCK